ncbi:MAG: MMPL family transporter [Myxococcales bacterium]|nr:MMPL family transporter [Polyangiaceae bacterium]MDW8251399.1 MMPL family transporter [Myxococcales bacterium]
MLRTLVVPLVELAARRPWLILLSSLAALLACWSLARRLELRTELRELLPRDSPGFRAYERQAGRVEGGASLIVIARSPERSANERFIDALASTLHHRRMERSACHAYCQDEPCRQTCPPETIRAIEAGAHDVQAYFARTRWLYASIEELEQAEQELQEEFARRSGLVPDLETSTPPASSGGAPSSLQDRLQNLDRKPAALQDFPSGYFSTPDGGMVALRLISRSSGLGDHTSSMLLREVEEEIQALSPRSFHPSMEVGLAGDIPNAIAEQRSIMTEAAWATALSLVMILLGVVFFYRSPWSILIIGLPAFCGVGGGYAFASLAFGYVNTVGAFLGAIILGNGINYPIVLLSRYRDFLARGFAPETARVEAVINAFRAELVGASVASIAYGSLMVTRFRGFSQFGAIGFVGMLLVWLSIVPLVPALLVLVERLQRWLPPWLRDPEPRREKGDLSPGGRLLVQVIQRATIPAVVGAAMLAVLAATRLPSFLQDPWEYNFARLGSKQSQTRGAGLWSVRASEVFGGKMNVAGALLLTDRPEQVQDLKRRILAADAMDPEGSLIHSILTVDDLLPGAPEEQRRKLEILARIRKLGARIVATMPEEERQEAAALLPPNDLTLVSAADLPPLLRRRFEESNGVVGAVFYVRYRNDVSFSDGRILLRMARTTGQVKLDQGTTITTASRATVFAEMIQSMERDGPLATMVALGSVSLVVILATRTPLGAALVLGSLALGVLWLAGALAFLDVRLNFLNFIALPITFGIGCEYPFNVFDRTRLLGGDVDQALQRSAGPVALCSYTTVLGYGSLMFADNQALQSFGKVAVIGELACTLAALVILPAVLRLLNRSRSLRDAYLGHYASGELRQQEGA